MATMSGQEHTKWKRLEKAQELAEQLADVLSGTDSIDTSLANELRKHAKDWRYAGRKHLLERELPRDIDPFNPTPRSA